MFLALNKIQQSSFDFETRLLHKVFFNFAKKNKREEKTS